MKKILAALKDTGELSRTIAQTAAYLCKIQEAELFFTYVYEVPLCLPLDEETPEELEKGDSILDQASAIAEELEVSSETHIIQARAAGAGLLDEVIDMEADLLILGMKHNPAPGEIPLGTDAKYLIRSAPCQVMLIRPASNIEESK